jgi:hypothetical protein
VEMNNFPEWAKEEIKQLPAHSSLVLLLPLLSKPEMQATWDSFGKVAIVPNKLFDRFDDTRWYNTRVGIIDNALHNGFHRPYEKFVFMTGGEKKRRAGKIAKLAAELRKEVDFLSDDDGGWTMMPNAPYSFQNEFDIFTTDIRAECGQYFLEELGEDESDHQRFIKSLSKEQQDDVDSIIDLTLWKSVRELPYLLELLEQAAKNWATEKTELYRPDDKNAKRLLFLRKVTQCFVRFFGRPMREETLALASQFFDIDDIDAAALSRLAPVKRVGKGQSFKGKA